MEKELTPQEKWNKATLANNFIFYKVMRHHPEECKELLELLLQMEIDHIVMTQEESIDIDPFSKGIRMDVYAKNDTQVFDLEVQAIDTKELPERARYYQGIMDADNLPSGEVYSKLKESYIIFICLEDIFHQGLPLYRFENLCIEDNKIKLQDRTHKYFFAASNCDKLTDERQKAFFNLLLNNKINDSYTNRLSELLTEAKMNIQWRMQYMEFERELAYAKAAGRTLGYEIGIAEGKELGIERGKELGLVEGKELGLVEGKELGLVEGRNIGLSEGRELGLSEGKELGLTEGKQLGLAEGKELGLLQGKELGFNQGCSEQALKDAVILIKDFNISPELAAEKLGVDIDLLKEKLK